MKINGKEKWITFNVYYMTIISILGICYAIYELVTNDTVEIYIIFLIAICSYFGISSYYGFKTINKISITLESNILKIIQFEKKKGNIKEIFLYPYCTNRTNKMKYPTYQELNIKEIKEYGFVSDLKATFKNNLKFNIGFIDKDNNKYLIILKQFDDDEVFEIIKMIKSYIKKDPVGKLKDMIK